MNITPRRFAKRLAKRNAHPGPAQSAQQVPPRFARVEVDMPTQQEIDRGIESAFRLLYGEEMPQIVVPPMQCREVDVE